MNEPAGILAIVLGAAFLAPLVADLTGIPVFITISLCGFILGPSLAGAIEPNVLLQSLASVGLVFVFFSAGGSLGLDQVRKKPRRAIASGILSAGIPTLTGFLIGFLILKLPMGISLLLGGFFASSSGNTDTPQTADSGFNLGNALVVLVLLIMEYSRAGSPIASRASFGFLDFLIPLAYMAALAFLLPAFVSLAASKTRIQGKTDALFALLAIYASAAAAPLVGFPTYVGGFLSGIFLSSHLKNSKPIASRLDFIGGSFLLPFFLVSAGSSIVLPPVEGILPFSLVVLALTTAVLGAKYLASLLIAWLFGWDKEQRRAHFRRLAAFDSFSLGLAWLGGASGLIDSSLVTGAFALCVVSSLASTALGGFSKSAGKKEISGSEAAKSRGGRILVALSKPTSSQRLVELGLLLHGRDPAAPLLPCAIIQDGEEEGESRTFAENMLAAAVIQGSSAQVPVLPVTKNALNAAEGIMECAVENKADTILIGWNKPPRLSNAFFGSVIEQIASSEERMTLVARLASPLGTSHLTLILPSLCDTHPGFPAAASMFALLADKMRAKIRILALEGQGKNLAQAFQSASSGSAPAFVEIPSWKDVVESTRSLQLPSRFFALFSARPSEPSWHPALERIPHRLGEEYPDANILLFYMAQGSSERPAKPEASASAGLLEAAIRAGTVRLDMEHAAIADGIFDLVASAFPFDRRTATKTAARLTDIVQRQPLEIEPGVVLIHDRLPRLSAPILCLGSRKSGFRLSLLERGVQVLVLILVPEEQSAEDHLAYLGETARMFRENDLARRMVDAAKPEDLFGLE